MTEIWIEPGGKIPDGAEWVKDTAWDGEPPWVLDDDGCLIATAAVKVKLADAENSKA